MEEIAISFDALSDINCRFVLQHYDADKDGVDCVVLIAAFDGEYREGAQGNNDAVYMTAMLCAAFCAWTPLALVIDLEKLGYTWGDMMESPLRAGETYRRWAGGLATMVVASPRNERALRSLIDSVIGDDPDDWLRPSREEAIACVLDKCRASDSSVG